MLSTVLTRDWGLRHPIVLAPMAGWSGGELAAAVSAAGGLGLVGVGNASSARWVAEQGEIAARHRPFGFGLQIWALRARPEQFAAVLAAKPDAVSLSFGDLAQYVERVHDAGARVLAQVSDGEMAERAAADGVDALVAQGTEAGGHTGQVGTLPLLQRVLEVGERAGLPVLAAGGIATGTALAGVLAMGAAGAWIGTRFMTAREASGADAAKRRILDADERQTVHTRVFDVTQGLAWPEEFPGRALRNRFAERWHGREDELEGRREQLAPELAAAQRAGDYDEAYVYAGQGVGVIRDAPPAAAIVERLVADAERRLRDATGLLGRRSECPPT